MKGGNPASLMSSLSVWFKDDFYATLLIWALQKFFVREKNQEFYFCVYQISPIVGKNWKADLGVVIAVHLSHVKTLF